MFEKLLKKNDRGQVGIGTLIVFIAMVLVAAIAAGVLINTAGFLQTKSQATGEQSSAQVSNRVIVLSTVGNVNANQTNITDITATVMKSPGSDNINLSEATVQWTGKQAVTLTGSVNATVDEDTYNVTGIEGKGTPPVLTEQSDRLQLKFDATKIGAANLAPGDEVTLTVTTQSGASTVYTLTVPESLEGKSAVNL